MKGGTVRITDSSLFKMSKTIAAALVEVESGAVMRELHWHPNVDEWQYYISGRARMTAFLPGAIDAISFLALGKVFSAFMTGNIAFLGLRVAGASNGARAVCSYRRLDGRLRGGGCTSRPESSRVLRIPGIWSQRVTVGALAYR